MDSCRKAREAMTGSERHREIVDRDNEGFGEKAKTRGKRKVGGG